MADISKFERKQNSAAAKKARSSGDITDYNDVKGRKNFSGPKESKSGLGVSPKASGSPWKYGRSDQQEADYSKDYTRRGSSASASGPYKPSDSIPDAIYRGSSDQGERGKQTKDHV